MPLHWLVISEVQYLNSLLTVYTLLTTAGFLRPCTNGMMLLNDCFIYNDGLHHCGLCVFGFKQSLQDAVCAKPAD